MKSITLIGMPGSGKSFYGKIIAKKLGWDFFDTDKEILKNSDKCIQELVEEDEENVLDLEEKIVLNIKDFNNKIISTGGSVCYSEKAMKFLRKNSLVVFLDADFKLIKKNLDGKEGKRGIINLRDNSLEDLYFNRRILYEENANIILKIKNRKNGVELVDKFILLIK